MTALEVRLILNLQDFSTIFITSPYLAFVVIQSPPPPEATELFRSIGHCICLENNQTSS